MNRFYSKLYQFRFQHEFYTNLVSEDFIIYPLNDSAKWIKGNGMMVKSENDGFDLIYRREDELSTDPFMTIDESKVLKFAIELRNRNILNVTAPPPKTNASDIYICSGAYDDSVVSLTTIPTRQTQFTELYSYAFSQMTFQITDLDDNVVYEKVQSGMQDPDNPAVYNFSASVNLGNSFEHGRYKLKSVRNGVVQDELTVYIYNRYEVPNLFGIFELELDENMDYTVLPYSATLTFTAFENKWVYSVELTKTYLAASLAVTDTTPGSPISFNMVPPIPTYTAGEKIVFTSSVDIKKTEAPQSKLQLKLTATDTSITLDKLPNPVHDNQNSIVYLKL